MTIQIELPQLKKEQVIKRALYDILKNTDEVERIFLIVKQQAEY